MSFELPFMQDSAGRMPIFQFTPNLRSWLIYGTLENQSMASISVLIERSDTLTGTYSNANVQAVAGGTPDPAALSMPATIVAGGFIEFIIVPTAYGTDDEFYRITLTPLLSPVEGMLRLFSKSGRFGGGVF